MMLSLPQLIPSKIGHILEVSVTKNLSCCAETRKYPVPPARAHIRTASLSTQCRFLYVLSASFYLVLGC